MDLAALQAATDLLLRAGPIGDLNTVRKHLSLVKGGGLARQAAPATVLTLVLSDVIGDPLDVIASGPLSPDPTTFADAGAVLARYELWSRVPCSVAALPANGIAGRAPETPKPGDTVFATVRHLVIGNNALAVGSAVESARAVGFNVLPLSTYVEGEAREVGRLMGAIAREMALRSRPLPRPACLVLGGETTVTAAGGQGGRTRKLRLAPSPASRTYVTCSFERCHRWRRWPHRRRGRLGRRDLPRPRERPRTEPVDALDGNDSYPFFAALGDLLQIGPTLTNVDDLIFVYAF